MKDDDEELHLIFKQSPQGYALIKAEMTESNSLILLKMCIAQSAVAAEYTDCTTAKSKISLTSVLI